MIYIELPDGRKVSWLIIAIGVGGAVATSAVIARSCDAISQ